MSATEPTFGEVSHLLAQRMEQLVDVLQLRGTRQGAIFSALNPNRADHHAGSFQIYIGGSRQGRWREYAGSKDEGGDALDLVAYVQLGRPASSTADKRDAFRWACRWLGVGDVERLGTGGGAKMAKLRAEIAARVAQAERVLAAETARQRKGAMAMWLNAEKLRAPEPGEAPSPAWRYLAGQEWPQRGVPLRDLARLPSAIRWTATARHVESEQEVPALVSGIFAAGGQLLACHRTFLQPDGSDKLQVAPRRDGGRVAVKKIWPAGWKGGVIPISRGKCGLDLNAAIAAGVKEELCVAEGIEDALTVAVLQPTWRVWAAVTQGNFAEIPVPACASAVIVARDNDKNARTRAAVTASIAALRLKASACGVELYETRAQGGAKDFNDMIRPPRPAEEAA